MLNDRQHGDQAERYQYDGQQDANLLAGSKQVRGNEKRRIPLDNVAERPLNGAEWVPRAKSDQQLHHQQRQQEPANALDARGVPRASAVGQEHDRQHDAADPLCGQIRQPVRQVQSPCGGHERIEQHEAKKRAAQVRQSQQEEEQPQHHRERFLRHQEERAGGEDDHGKAGQQPDGVHPRSPSWFPCIAEGRQAQCRRSTGTGFKTGGPVEDQTHRCSFPKSRHWDGSGLTAQGDRRLGAHGAGLSVARVSAVSPEP